MFTLEWVIFVSSLFHEMLVSCVLQNFHEWTVVVQSMFVVLIFVKAITLMKFTKYSDAEISSYMASLAMLILNYGMICLVFVCLCLCLYMCAHFVCMCKHV